MRRPRIASAFTAWMRRVGDRVAAAPRDVDESSARILEQAAFRAQRPADRRTFRELARLRRHLPRVAARIEADAWQQLGELLAREPDPLVHSLRWLRREREVAHGASAPGRLH